MENTNSTSQGHTVIVPDPQREIPLQIQHFGFLPNSGIVWVLKTGPKNLKGSLDSGVDTEFPDLTNRLWYMVFAILWWDLQSSLGRAKARLCKQWRASSRKFFR